MSVAAGLLTVGTGRSLSTRQLTSRILMWSFSIPVIVGIVGFTSTMTCSAASTISCVATLLRPYEKFPFRSMGDTVIIATFTGA